VKCYNFSYCKRHNKSSRDS